MAFVSVNALDATVIIELMDLLHFCNQTVYCLLQEVIRITRDFKCCAGGSCCAFADCCALEVIVEAPVGTVVGYVKQE